MLLEEKLGAVSRPPPQDKIMFALLFLRVLRTLSLAHGRGLQDAHEKVERGQEGGGGLQLLTGGL